MRQLEEHKITLHWTDCLKRIEGLKPNKANAIEIKRDIVPVIFVPGIMGSKLKIKNPEQYPTNLDIERNPNGHVWDPDNTDLMTSLYLLDTDNGANRQRLLVGANRTHDPEYLEVCYPESLAPDAVDLGWNNVSESSYGGLRKTLLSYEPAMPLKTCFEYVPHAFGYNWTACNSISGAKLKEYIERLLEHYTELQNKSRTATQKRRCEKVILITHSMGGLVARSACQQGAESKVLGVIHGVQPVTGSPAAYWRMKAGFLPFAGLHNDSGEKKEEDGFFKKAGHSLLTVSQKHLSRRLEQVQSISQSAYSQLETTAQQIKALGEKAALSIYTLYNSYRDSEEHAATMQSLLESDYQQIDACYTQLIETVKQTQKQSVPLPFSVELLIQLVNEKAALKKEFSELLAPLTALALPSILGPKGSYVTALLSFMPGALELLPNSDYTTNKGQTAWLSFTDGDGQTQRLPKSDPYTEIYGEPDKFYRLVEPEWLVPGAKDNRTVAIKSALTEYGLSLRDAKKFHNTLKNYVHPDSYQFYASDVITSDAIEYKRSSLKKGKYTDLSKEREQHLLKQLFSLYRENVYSNQSKMERTLKELQSIQHTRAKEQSIEL